jgi:hypothetical protein
MSTGPADPALARRIAASFSDVQPRFLLVARLVAGLMGFGIVVYLTSVVIRVNLPGFGGDSIQIDFAAFWAAAKLALGGDAAAAFDLNRLREVMAFPPKTPVGDMLWLYPPAWHMAIMPFGLLPFSAAFVIYSAITYLAFAASVRRLAAPLPGGVALLLAGPAMVLILQFGNNSLLWTAGLVAALASLANGRAAAAGGLIALLTLKPQLGLLIPVALVAGGHWRTVAWATAGTLTSAALSTVAMGADYWLHWIDMLRTMTWFMEIRLVRFNLMITWYALARSYGVSHDIAFALQIVVLLAAAAAVAWVWRRPVTADLRAATLCVAIPVATPYAWHYEMSLVLVAAMFLARDGFGATTGARVWLFALWLGQVPGLALLPHVPPALYSAPLLTATLGLCVWRARSSNISGAA